MNHVTRIGWISFGTAVVLTATGCATSSPVGGPETAELQRALEEKNRELEETQAEVSELNRKLEAQQDELPPVSARASVGGDDLLPPAAKPGECYARAYIPASYTSGTEQVLKRAAASRVEVIPAKYGFAEERVLVKEATTRLEVVPATYGWEEERVLVKAASSRLVEVPATYGYEEEKILVKPAHTVWKKGTGAIQRIDDATGEIMCLVEVPAEYKTVKRRVQTTPPTTRTVEIPAEYKTVKRRVQKTPATTRTIEIPAEYKTVKVRTVTEPARENKVEIPAQYATVTKRTLVKEGRMEWRPVLCETNATRSVISQIQRALTSAGHDAGPVDGVIGRQTLAAVRSYQEQKRLPKGGLNYETISALGVKVGR